MHGNSDDLPLDFSKTREVPTCSTSSSSRDGSDATRPQKPKRFDMNYVVSDPYRPPLGDHGRRFIPSPHTGPEISTPWSSNFRRTQEHSTGYQGNERYGRRYNPMRSQHTGSYRGFSIPVSSHITESSTGSRLFPPSVSTSNEFRPGVIPVSPRYYQMQSAAIPASNGFSPMQSAAIPTSNMLDVYSLHPSVSSSSHFSDHLLKPVTVPMTDSSTVVRKSSKLRPFKAFENEYLRADISTGMGHGMNAAQALQCVESTCHRNTSSPKSCPIGNGESSNESMDNSRDRKESPPKSDSYESGVVGSSQVEESAQNLGSPDNSYVPRRKGQPIPDEQKTDAYWEKRRKNNKAAKKSRDSRRQKEDVLTMKFMNLKEVNERLEVQLADQEQQIKNLSMYCRELEIKAFSEAMKYVIQRRDVSSGCENCGHAISGIPKEH